jgi:hypothetical protein
MPTNYIKVSSNWKPVSQFWTKVSTTWKSVSQGWINVAGVWKQFFASTEAYTFYLGNTIHISTNGYIALDSGQSTDVISSTVDRVLGILPANLELSSIRYAADSSKFYMFWRGKRVGGSNFEIEYEVHFTNGQDYALIKLVAFPIGGTYANTAYYVDGSRTGYSAIESARTVGAEYRVYFDTTEAFATDFTEYGSSTNAVWLSQSTLTSGTADTGYITITANQGSSPQAPTSITASSITNTTATVSWNAILNANAGMSAIQYYEYSTNSGSSWTSTSTNTSVNLTGLTANTSYTVLVRAQNAFFTGTSGSVTFSTTNLTVPNAVTGLSSTAISGGARISWSAPSSDGGSAITRYEVKRDSFAYFSVGLSTSYDYTLSPGTYTIYVRAVNAIGNGTESFISVTVAAPPASVTLIFGYTGGRIANNNWANPKATMDYYFSNVTSATARIQRSSDNSTWTSGATESLSVSGGYASQSTNQPVGTSNAVGNFWYRAQVISLNGITLSPTITSASFQNTATAKSAQLYP